MLFSSKYCDTDYAPGVGSDTAPTATAASTTPVHPFDFDNIDLSSLPPSPTTLGLLDCQGLLKQSEAAFVGSYNDKDRHDRAAASALQRRALRSFVAASIATALQLERVAASIAAALGSHDARYKREAAGASVEALRVLRQLRCGLATKKRFLDAFNAVGTSDTQDSILSLSSAAIKKRCTRCETSLP